MQLHPPAAPAARGALPAPHDPADARVFHRDIVLDAALAREARPHVARADRHVALAQRRQPVRRVLACVLGIADARERLRCRAFRHAALRRSTRVPACLSGCLSTGHVPGGCRACMAGSCSFERCSAWQQESCAVRERCGNVRQGQPLPSGVCYPCMDETAQRGAPISLERHDLQSIADGGKRL